MTKAFTYRSQSAPASRRALPTQVKSTWAKLLRMFMVFVLVFGTSLHFEYRLAYADDNPADGSISRIDISFNPEPPYSIEERGGNYAFSYEAFAPWTEIKTVEVDNETTDEGNPVTKEERVEHNDLNITDWFEWSASEGATVQAGGGQVVVTADGTYDGDVNLNYTLKDEYFAKLDRSSSEFSGDVIKTRTEEYIEEGDETQTPKTREVPYYEGSISITLANQIEEEPVVESYAYVESVFIVQSDGTDFDSNTGGRGGSSFSIALEEGASSASYPFLVRVTVVPDSSNPVATPFICTSNADLLTQLQEAGITTVLDNPEQALVWEIQDITSSNTPVPTDGEEGEEAEPSAADATLSDDGLLTIAASTQARIICSTYSGERLEGGEPGNTWDEILVSTAEQQEDDGDDENSFQIEYVANGGTGTMDPTKALASEEDPDILQATVAENGFAPPSGNAESPADNEGDTSGTEDSSASTSEAAEATGDESSTANDAADSSEADTQDSAKTKTYAFKDWNTAADGTGTSYQPHDVISPMTENVVLYAQWAEVEESDEGEGEFSISYDANGGTGEMEASKSNKKNKAKVAPSAFKAPEGMDFDGWNTEKDGTGQAFEPNKEVELTSDLLLYAQWTDEGAGDVTPPSEDGKLHVVISYSPVPKGETAALAPLASGVSGGEFGFIWEVSKDKGQNWEEADSGNSPQTLLVPTTDETIGNYYRVNVYCNRIDDEGHGYQESAVSEPVVLREGKRSLKLNYTPNEFGKEAQLSVTVPPSLSSIKSFEWQVWKEGGTNWEAVPNVTGATHSLTTDENTLGSYYRVRAIIPDSSESSASTEDTEEPAADANESESSNAAEAEADSSAPASETEVTDSSAQGATKYIYSNIQQIVAVVPDSTITPGEKPIGWADEDENINDDSITDDSIIGDDSIDEFDDGGGYVPDEIPGDVVEQIQEQLAEGDEAIIEYDDGTSTTVTPVENIVQEKDLGNQVAPPQNTIIANNEVAKEITGNTSANVESQVTNHPGSKWRAVSIIPDQETIQEILDDNPFAPFVVPLALALIAVGMVERIISYRAQRRPSAVNFA
ncbi:MAG: InlB B-repeat-containing protein [Eggerthellaceae bacterium]|nr:InlB B-repeat-containing protein [Eggerthellaceae bacterium]